jgi:hypothetical protein
MNYAPAVTDQSGNLIMQGNRMSQESGQNAIRLWQYLQGRSDAKDAALGQLDVMGAGGNGGTSTASSGGFDPSVDPAGEVSPSLDDAESAGKKAEAIRNVLTAYNPHPQAKTALKAMSLGQLEGMLKGYAAKSAMDEHAARMQDYQAQAQLRTQQAADDQSIGAFLKNYASAPDVDEYQGEGQTMPRPANPTERFNYAMKISPVSGRAVPRLIDSLTKYGQATEDNSPVVTPGPYPGVSIVGSRSGRGGVHVVTDPNAGPEGQSTPIYTEDPVSGTRFMTYGKVAQPSGVNPAKAQLQPIPMHDEDGNLMGWSLMDSRGRGQFTPYHGPGLKPAINTSTGEDIPGVYVDSKGNPVDYRTEMQKAYGNRAATGAPSGGGPGAKGTKADTSGYQSKGEVIAAFKANKISRTEAAAILSKQFGVPLK